MMPKRILWTIEVTRHLNELLESYIGEDAYKTKSEFIRVAVRDRLEREFEKLPRKEECRKTVSFQNPPEGRANNRLRCQLAGHV